MADTFMAHRKPDGMRGECWAVEDGRSGLPVTFEGRDAQPQAREYARTMNTRSGGAEVTLAPLRLPFPDGPVPGVPVGAANKAADLAEKVLMENPTHSDNLLAKAVKLLADAVRDLALPRPQ